MRQTFVAVLFATLALAWLVDRPAGLITRRRPTPMLPVRSPSPGVVKKVEFTNPHAFIYVEVAGADGGPAKVWALELMSIRALKLLGWLKRHGKGG